MQLSLYVPALRKSYDAMKDLWHYQNCGLAVSGNLRHYEWLTRGRISVENDINFSGIVGII